MIVPQTGERFLPPQLLLVALPRPSERGISMFEFARNVFSSHFMPLGGCFLSNPEIVWRHAISDRLLTLARIP